MRRRLTRRRALLTLGASVAGAAAWLKLGPRAANAYYAGPVSDHFDGLRFFNPGGQHPSSAAAYFKLMLTERAAIWPASVQSPFSDRPPARVDDGSMRVAFIGHASFLLQVQGRNILIDPVYVQRVSPIPFTGPTRVNPPAIAFDDLPRIDAVLVSHNHYDHMDLGTLGRLWARDGARIVTSLGNDTIIRSAVPGIAVSAHDWGDRVALGDGLAVHLVPTQHWSARGIRDRRHALWCGFVLETLRHRVYIVPDTGFGDGRTFRAVRQTFPVLDLALLPIGAYEPRWFMMKQHVNPEEAVAAFVLSGAKRALGHHWGTFQLTSEPYDAPPAALAVALAERGLEPRAFHALRPGEVETLG